MGSLSRERAGRSSTGAPGRAAASRRPGSAAGSLLAAAALSLATAAAPAWAQEAAPAVRMSVRECIERALAQNLTLATQRLETEIADWTLRGERAAFEPDLVGSVGRNDIERENTTEQEISQRSLIYDSSEYDYELGIEGLVPTGGRYRLGYSLFDISNNLTNVFRPVAYEDEYVAFVGLNLVQPLLKGAGLNATLARIRIAAAGSQIAVQDQRRRMMQVISQTELSYWDLHFAQEQFNLRGNSVGIAEKILTDNRERVKTGKMSELEVLQAEAGLAVRQTLRGEAMQKRVDAANRLKSLFSESVTELLGLIETADQPAVQAVEAEYAERMARALARHPEYLAKRKELEQEKIRLAFAQNQRWPQLDLQASYGVNGLAKTPADTWDDLNDGEYPSWSVAAQLRVPLGGGGRTRADLEVARRGKEQALQELKQIEIELGNALATALNNVQSTGERVRSYQAVVDFNQRLLENELSRLALGRSDSRKVLEIEEDLYEANDAQLEALVDHQKAAVELAYVEGSILDSRGYEIMSPEPAPAQAAATGDAVEAPAGEQAGPPPETTEAPEQPPVESEPPAGEPKYYRMPYYRLGPGRASAPPAGEAVESPAGEATVEPEYYRMPYYR